jgi:hypothetical protein
MHTKVFMEDKKDSNDADNTDEDAFQYYPA